MIHEARGESDQAELLQFKWTVRPRVYRWIDGKGEPTFRPALSGEHLDRWLVTQGSLSAGKILLTEDPLDQAHHSGAHDAPLETTPRLFVTFAELKSADEILVFAREYGPLGGPARFRVLDDQSDIAFRFGEPLRFWLGESQGLRLAIEIWQCWQNSDKKGLNSWFTRRGNDYRFDDGRSERELVSPAASPELLARLAGADILSVAEYYLTSVINRKLWDAVAAGFVWDRGDNPFLMRIIPRHMLAYLWLEFALAVGCSTRIRSCGFCGRWILIEPPDSRATRRYCSDACRQKHYQRLKRDERLKQAAGSRTRRVSKRSGRSTKNNASKQKRNA